VAVGEIVAGQPFHSYEDFKARTTRRGLNKKRVETLAVIGAFESFGIEGEADDALQFKTLGFTLRKPKALRNLRPKHVRSRHSDRGWIHHGLDKSVEITEGRASVSKLFWIPDLEDEARGYKGFDLKASPWAQVKTNLLLAVDVNGIPFHIMANEDKEYETMMLRIFSDKFRGYSVCLEGSIRQPFLNDGPMGFRFYGISGADFHSDPQMWRKDGTPVGNKTKQGFSILHQRKRAERRNS
jgi:hypothetical protein